MTITEFLEARIAEDEAEAREMGGREWSDGAWSDEHERKIIAECKAKRAIIALTDEVGGMDAAITGEWGGPGYGTADQILNTLAAVYSDHPDYDERWAL